MRVWDAMTGQPVTPPLRQDGFVWSAKFSPDGQRIVTASADKTARVWDTRTGSPVTSPLKHEDAVSSAEFSPDGRRIVTASYDKTVQVWDAQTRAVLSCDAVTTRRPSGLDWAEMTAPSCLSGGVMGWPFSASHTRAVPS